MKQISEEARADLIRAANEIIHDAYCIIDYAVNNYSRAAYYNYDRIVAAKNLLDDVLCDSLLRERDDVREIAENDR